MEARTLVIRGENHATEKPEIAGSFARAGARQGGGKRTLLGVTLGVVLLIALAVVAHLAFFSDNEPA